MWQIYSSLARCCRRLFSLFHGLCNKVEKNVSIVVGVKESTFDNDSKVCEKKRSERNTVQEDERALKALPLSR
jgi:hypothetical protein